jgi:hypothetical protein
MGYKTPMADIGYCRDAPQSLTGSEFSEIKRNKHARAIQRLRKIFALLDLL